MRLLAVIRKGVLQTLRDPVGLALTLLTPAFFVLLYRLVFDASAVMPEVVVVAETPSVRAMMEQKELGVELTFVESEAAMRDTLVRKGGGIGIVLQQDQPPRVYGDLAEPSTQLMAEGILRRIERHEAQAVSVDPRAPFNRYVPGLLVFAVIMLVFSASMSVAREIERGALIRLRLTQVSSITLLGGMSLVQLALGVITVMNTLVVALLLGFESVGALGWVLLLGGIGSFSSIGIGMVVASLSPSTTRAFLVSSVAMFLLLLFSGVVFPRPQVDLFTIGTRTLGVFDLLPTTHLNVGLTKVARLGARGSEITYELSALTGLSLITFAVGAAIFRKTQRLSPKR